MDIKEELGVKSQELVLSYLFKAVRSVSQCDRGAASRIAERLFRDFKCNNK